ncbi:efflux RND transporter permease subunit [Bittarella massiliensis (ex Durand et al. 2017)]|uniref:efflux RND transporter permease subunit n=1 Tax=Bittarella massiliensis (ex Durand et al. 2017) TaxID=1720313 RepID=UPI001AA0D1EA|nr:MMPL family transporter [Bittarella massiliensis (ex Durand et al. 2017)]MBO1680714.1 MMPL family transporter [Bittarella massiliensis (ex Durand et al. 2017)]
MKEKAARFVVKKRIAILILAVALLIPSAIGFVKTFVNYDILTYLPADLDSMIGQKMLEDDFHMASTAMLVVDGMEDYQVSQLKEKVAAVPGVRQVLWADDIFDNGVPREMLPEDVKSVFYSDSGTMMIISFEDPMAAEGTLKAIEQIKSVTGEQCFLGGMAAIVQDTKALADQETPLYVLVAVLLCMAVLWLGLESTVVPFIFLLGILFPILYNFGTNIFLGQISYITKALAAVLQLGVTMDFSIFLLHRFEEEKQRCPDKEEAMVKAISATLTSIAGSSVTTIAGFLALCTMRLTLGRDIGIVMAKGVLLGVICTVTVLPALILFFDRAIDRHTHPVLIHELERVPAFICKHYKGILVAFVALFIPFAIAQANTDQYYALDETLPKDLPSIVGTNKLKNDFNMTTTHFVLVDDQLDSYRLKEISDRIEELDGVDLVISYDKYVGGRIPDDVIPDELRDQIDAGGKKLMMVNSVYKAASDEENRQIDRINEIVKAYDPTAVVAGEGAMTKDLIEVAAVDFKNVNIASIAAIFLIIAVCFRSASIPFLLVLAIEFAISINMGIPFFTGTTLPFVAGIVIGTIQLGATVDYAILTTTRFREELQAGREKMDAIRVTVQKCSPSIITSGLSFFAANIGVAIISKMDLIKSLCGLMARGAIISMLSIIFVLPALLILCEPLIAKTTIGWRKAAKLLKGRKKEPEYQEL